MKLSIITVNLNNAEGLRKTIESVISQTYSDFEYIVIDGASTDGSVDIIKKYANEMTYWVSEPDKGIYNAMNKGINIAKGEYLLFLNSGDCLIKDEILSEIAVNQKFSDIFFGSVRILNAERKILYPPEDITFRFLYNTNIPHQAEFIKKELFLKYGLYDEKYKILADYDFNIRMMLNGVIFEMLDLIISEVEAEGISSNTINLKKIDSERELIFSSNFPKGVLKDYYYFMDKKSFSHPSILWVVKNKNIFKLIKFLYKYLS